MEGQNFTASGERQFDGYKLYQAADANELQLKQHTHRRLLQLFHFRRCNID